jgi:triosephosphate isomerase
VANWKSHKTLVEGEKWLTDFLQVYRPDPHVKIILAPSYIHLVSLYRMLQDNKLPFLSLAVQNLSPFPMGAYNGAVAAAMVQGIVDYAIIGHADRRRYFHETNQEIANKASEAAAVGIKPILCVDQPYAHTQMTALNDADMENMFIGYGPVEAIGVDIPQSLEKTRQVVEELQEIFPGKPILYGGSINAENAGSYMQLAGLSGLMVGSASLEPAEFARLCQIVSQA